MKVVHTEDIVRKGTLAESEDIKNIFTEIEAAIKTISCGTLQCSNHCEARFEFSL